MASKFLVPLEVPNYLGTPADKADAGFALLYIKHGWATRQDTGGVETDLVLARPLDGFSLPLTATPVTNADTVKSALEKLQQSLLSVTLSGDVSGTAAYNAGVLEIVATYTGNTASTVATAFNVKHYSALGNEYLAGDIVYKDGHIFKALYTNDAIVPTIGGNLYWQDLGVGNQLRQTPADWDAVEGDGQILNKPYIPTLTSDLTNDSGFISSNIYTADGTLTGNRAVTMGGFTLSFERDLLINGARIGRGVNNITTNLIFGEGVLAVNTTGNSNLAVGNFALAAGTGADLNTAIGNYALYTASTADANVAVGGAALFLSQTGFENVAVGYQNQRNNTTGGYNVALGARSMYFNTTGAYNTAVGNRAGAYITGGTVGNTISTNSIYIGYFTKALADNQTNQIVIGYNETGLGSNTTIIGNSSTLTTAIRGRLLLGTTTDTGTYQLDVNGTARVTGFSHFTAYFTAVQRLQFNNGSTATNFGLITASGNGIFRLVDSSEANFGRLCFGGGTSAFPALQRSGSALCVVDAAAGGLANLLVGTTTDIASSKLTIESTTQGFLPPRMTTTQKNAIASPAPGLVVYDSTDNRHYGFDGLNWNSFYVDLSTLGLQNAITTNNVLNTDNAIDGTGLNIDWTFRKTSWNGDGIFDIMMDDGSNQYSQLKVNIFGGGPGSVLMKTYDYTSGNYTSVETYAAALLVRTLQVSTKAAGDVLTLVDPLTGEVEYNTPSGGVTASQSIINALIFG